MFAISAYTLMCVDLLVFIHGKDGMVETRMARIVVKDYSSKHCFDYRKSFYQ